MEYKFLGANELQNKIAELKGLLAHKHPNISLGELFDKLCDLGLAEWNPAKTAALSNRRVKPQSQAQIEKTVFLDAENHCKIAGRIMP